MIGSPVPMGNLEVVRPYLSPETGHLVGQLADNGYAVYALTGKSPADLHNEGMPFGSIEYSLKDLTAEPVLVAFHPAFIFLGRRFGRSITDRGETTYNQQLELLEEKKVEVARQFPDAGLVVRMGKPSEWVEAAFEHYKATGGVRLFGIGYGMRLTWIDAYEDDPEARKEYEDHATLDYCFAEQPYVRGRNRYFRGQSAGASRAVFGDWDERHGARLGFSYHDKGDEVVAGYDFAPLMEIPRNK